jgi:hypothetical protein
MKLIDRVSCFLKQHLGKERPIDNDTQQEEKPSQEGVPLTSKEIVLLISGGILLATIVCIAALYKYSTHKELPQKIVANKDWLPPHQNRTDSAVLEKALKDIKVHAATISLLEKRWREESLTSELRWQKIEETLSALNKNTSPSLMSSIEKEDDAVDLQIPTLRHDTLNLQAPEQPSLKKTEANYVPAGSFVKAVLLSGLDVSAGVSASQEPRPVLMRVMDAGSLPNNLKSQLTGCRLIGAAVGDVSSERAYIRLERLSCVQNEEFTDFPVFGYVSGTDGKVGIRGRVVMKDAAVVSRAFLSGFLGGLSDSAANGLTESSVSPLGQVNSIAAGDVLKYGGYEGASSAMDLYADYLIKRAEQYQPVIEVSAGTPVDVVFHKGFYLEGLSEKDAAPMKASKTLPTFYSEKTSNEEEN